jgi:hypothetical protein
VESVRSAVLVPQPYASACPIVGVRNAASMAAAGSVGFVMKTLLIVKRTANARLNVQWIVRVRNAATMAAAASVACVLLWPLIATAALAPSNARLNVRGKIAVMMAAAAAAAVVVKN